MPRQFSSIFPYLFFPTLLFLPLSRPPYHTPELLLFCVLGIFLVNSRSWKHLPAVRRAVAGAGVASVLLAVAQAFSYQLGGSVLPILTCLLALSIIPMTGYVAHVFGWRFVRVVFLAMIVLYAQWGVVQFVGQADAGFNLLGESDISPLHEAVAKFSIGDEKILRAYGPFLHANTFGGVMVLGIILLFSLSRLFQTKVSGAYGTFFLPTVFLLLLALIISFSRAALVGGVVASLLGLIIYRGRWAYVSLVSCILLLMFTPLFFFRASDVEDMAYSERGQGIMWWQEVISAQPLWRGVGVGGYTSALRSHLQQLNTAVPAWQIAPVHAVPLLLLVELGVGWAMLLLVLVVAVLVKRPGMWLAVGPLLPALLLDHYFFTQVGPLALGLVILLCLGARSENE